MKCTFYKAEPDFYASACYYWIGIKKHWKLRHDSTTHKVRHQQDHLIMPVMFTYPCHIDIPHGCIVPVISHTSELPMEFIYTFALFDHPRIIGLPPVNLYSRCEQRWCDWAYPTNIYYPDQLLFLYIFPMYRAFIYVPNTVGAVDVWIKIASFKLIANVHEHSAHY